MSHRILLAVGAGLFLTGYLVGKGAGFPDANRDVPEELRNLSVQALFENDIVAKVNRDVITLQEIRERLGPALKTLGNRTPQAIIDLQMRELIKIMQEKIEDSAVARYKHEVQERQVELQIQERMKEAGGEKQFRNVLAEQGVTFDEFKDQLERELARIDFLRTQLGIRPARRAEQRTRFDLEVSPDEMLAHYRSHLDDYKITARAKVRKIYFSTRKLGGEGRALEEAEGVLEAMRKGGDFAELAQDKSHDKFRDKGGDLGWIQQGDKSQLAAIVDFAFSGKVGETSDIHRVALGFYVLYLEAREEGRVKPFSEVQDQIQKKLFDKKTGEIYVQIERELIERAYIDPPALKKLLLWNLGIR